MKVIKLLLIVLIVAVVGLVVFRNAIAQGVVTGITKQLTGLNVKTDAINLGIFDSSLGVKGFKLYNPAGFTDSAMIDLPDFFVDFSLADLLKNKVHLTSARMNLQEILIERNKNRESNVAKLQARAAGGSAAEKPTQAPKDKGPASVPAFQIDLLELEIGKLVYKDYSQTPPSVQEYNIGIKESFENITDFNTFIQLILTKAIARTALAGLLDFKGLQESLDQTVGQAQEELNKTVEEGKAQAEQAQKEAQAQAEGAEKEADRALEDLQKQFKTGLGGE